MDRSDRLGELVSSRQWQLAVAESLTGGQLSAAIARGADARHWFKGGLVAYQRAVKEQLLNVSTGPLVSERCVSEMATGAAALMRAEVGLAVTGVGGPQPDEGHEPGTVWIAVRTPMGIRSELYHLKGDSPNEICASSCVQAVELALTVLSDPPEE